MRWLLLFACLSGCYSMRWARFVDESEDTAKAWLCVKDDDPTNPLGIMCGDVANVEKARDAPGFEPGPGQGYQR